MRKPLLALLLPAVVSLSVPRSAAAQDAVPEPVDKPDTLDVTVGIGPAIGMSNFHITQIKLVEEVGLHLGGLVLSLALGESFGDDVFVFQAGARVGWESAVSVGATKVFVTPSALAGLFHVNVDAGGFGNASDTYFDMQLALDVRVPLGGSASIFVRPVALDFVFGDDDLAIRYDLIVGAGLRF